MTINILMTITIMSAKIQTTYFVNFLSNANSVTLSREVYSISNYFQCSELEKRKHLREKLAFEKIRD